MLAERAQTERQTEKERKSEKEREKERDRVSGEGVTSVLAGLEGKSTYRKDQRKGKINLPQSTTHGRKPVQCGPGRVVAECAGKESPACLRSGFRHRFSRLQPSDHLRQARGKINLQVRSTYRKINLQERSS